MNTMYKMDERFLGRRALVTGAGKGIGRAIALALQREGAHVTAISRTQADLDSLRVEQQAIEVLCLDVSKWSETRATLKQLPAFDLLVNNAGVTSLEPAINASEEEFDRVMSTNVKGAVNISQVVAESLIKLKRSGSIVNVSSVAAKKPIADHLIYCASKAALDSITQTMALEWGPHGIRVNSVNPTVVLTVLGRAVWDNEKGDEVKSRIPLRRFATEEDVAGTVLFLLSDQAAMISGACLPVDGGQLAA